MSAREAWGAVCARVLAWINGSPVRVTGAASLRIGEPIRKNRHERRREQAAKRKGRK